VGEEEPLLDGVGIILGVSEPVVNAVAED